MPTPILVWALLSFYPLGVLSAKLLLPRGLEHIFDKDPVSPGGVVD